MVAIESLSEIMLEQRPEQSEGVSFLASVVLYACNASYVGGIKVQGKKRKVGGDSIWKATKVKQSWQCGLSGRVPV
jgi:hypothetical protein